MKRALLLLIAGFSLLSCSSNSNSSLLASTSSIEEKVSSLSSEVVSSSTFVSTSTVTSTSTSSFTSSSTSSEFKEENWSSETLEIFESYLHTSNIPFIYQSYSLNLSFYDSDKTIVIFGENKDEDFLFDYYDSLIECGYKFHSEDSSDGSEVYRYDYDNHTLLANAFLNNGIFTMMLKVYLPFSEEGSWKNEDLYIFQSFLFTQNVPYGGYGEYEIVTSGYNSYGIIEIQYLTSEDGLEEDYASKLLSAGYTHEGYDYYYEAELYSLDVSELFYIEVVFYYYKEYFVIDFTVWGNLFTSTSWPKARVEEYTHGFEVPMLSASKYEYYYEVVMGGSFNLVCYGDYNSLLETYLATLNTASFKCENMGDYYFCYDSNVPVNVFLMVMPYEDWYGNVVGMLINITTPDLDF